MSKNETDTLGVENLFVTKEEQKLSVDILRKYLDEYELNSPIDKMLVKQLINLEVIQRRLQRIMNEDEVAGMPVSSKHLKTLHENLENIMKVTTKLGVTKDKQDSLKTDGYRALETMIKKAKIWREQNQLSRNIVCPECGKMFLLKRRTKSWKALNHPYIQDRILVNDEMLSWLGKGIITVAQYAKALGTSPDYITWMISRLSKEKMEKYNLYSFVEKDEVIEDSDDRSDN